MVGLTSKQAKFVEAYCGNATDAARQAGYAGNDNTLCSVGKENLRKPHIAAAIKAREDLRSAKLIATREERQQFWTSIMRGESSEEVDIKDRIRASEILGKSEGDFLDRVENSGEVSISIMWAE
jgi:phage terminase small subunit